MRQRRRQGSRPQHSLPILVRFENRRWPKVTKCAEVIGLGKVAMADLEDIEEVPVEVEAGRQRQARSSPVNSSTLTDRASVATLLTVEAAALGHVPN